MDELLTSEEFDKNLNANQHFTKTNKRFRKPKPVDALVDAVSDSEPVEEAKPQTKQTKSKANNLKVMFLGGIGEIGKNMTVLEYGNDIMVIDCGVMFPSMDMLGIDLVVPDVTYLVENKDKVRGFVITHGHEDHIGSIPYVIGEVDAPIYASKMTCGLIKKKWTNTKTSIIKWPQ